MIPPITNIHSANYRMELLLILNPDATIKDWNRFDATNEIEKLIFEKKQEKAKIIAERLNR